MDFLYGNIEPEVPPEFVPVETWPEYGYIAAPPPLCKREYVAGDYRVLRWSLWPLVFEQHIGDSVPDLKRSQQGDLTYNRFVIWKRVRRTDVPKGWFALSHKCPQVDGFKLLAGDPLDGWHKNARRDLRLWRERHEGKTHRLELVGIEEYKNAYDGSITAKHFDIQRPRDLERRLKYPLTSANTEMWVIRNLQSGKIAAGSGLVHSPTHKSSTHFGPFIYEEGRRIFGATALIGHWFERAKARGDVFVVTTNFWIPGQPKSWQGFSEFKSHFGWKYVAYPPELWRFVRGKLW